MFERLQQDLTPQQASNVDRRIWLLWLHSEDETVNRLMAQGMIAMRRGVLDQALQRFDAIIAHAPDFAEGWNKRATVLYMMGRHHESVADVQHVLNLEPRHYGALSGLGMILIALGREEEALAWLHRALELNPYLDEVRLMVDQIGERLKGKRI
ncbi:MAG: tetratricopeptide repeat protein [Alphaproteobacteria bacterium]|nr:tetratricopeptide repeat protein [Alphaproteobacteria bacterium]MCY4230397.1 tetratricopeptide repeat protein [Alphaproteobacteria bacterium]MCY4318189.1 tetratricopeptide repeat protein [Alphaproteobacteria bacterium]